MKITIETSAPEEERKLKRMFNADAVYGALWDISNYIFRPARKHGYPEGEIRKYLHEEISEKEYQERKALIGALEEKFRDILNDHGINLDDYT